jgi:hypothetical protein
MRRSTFHGWNRKRIHTSRKSQPLETWNGTLLPCKCDEGGVGRRRLVAHLVRAVRVCDPSPTVHAPGEKGLAACLFR